MKTNVTVNGGDCGALVHGDLGTPGKPDRIGQNLAYWQGGGPSGYVPKDGVDIWVQEGKDYDLALFDTKNTDPKKAASGCRTGSWADCGHYTQVGDGSARAVVVRVTEVVRDH